MIWSRLDDFALVPSSLARKSINGKSESDAGGLSEIDKFFGLLGHYNSSSGLAMNLQYDEEKALATMEIPGIEPEELDITVVGKVLSIKGEKKEEKLTENERYHSRERAYGSFSRSVTLPFSVDAENVVANYDKGVLKITLPRTHSEKPKKITVAKQ